MEKVAIKVEKRSKTGQASTTELRAEGKIPCVMYGGESVEHFAAHKNAFKTLIYTPDFKLAEIDIDGTLHKCIMKDWSQCECGSTRKIRGKFTRC
jgi:large subunit ribosomal protein L25